MTISGVLMLIATIFIVVGLGFIGLGCIRYMAKHSNFFIGYDKDTDPWKDEK